MNNLEKDNLMKQFAIGVYNKPENKAQLPSWWIPIKKEDNHKNGFHAEAFYKNGKIVIAYRGTDEIFKDLLDSDKDMFLKRIPTQTKDALKFYYEVETIAKKYNCTKEDIIITGHSLGGSLTQYVCYITGCEGVTFNAYGIKDTVERFGVVRNKRVNIRNYGNINDWTFAKTMHLQVGETKVIETNKYETRLRPNTYHKIEDMGDIKDAEPYDMYRHHKFEKETMKPDRVLVVEDVIHRKGGSDNDVFAHYFLQQAKNGNTMWRKEIDKKVSSGEVYVHSYMRGDGTSVREYYRSRPSY